MGFLILFFVSNSFFKGVGGYPITTPKLNPPNPKEALFKRLSLADESFLVLILKMPLSIFKFLPHNELV
ncbi:hypothetical protein BB472_02730 [Helicobacter pylori]|uniref:Uncharacterized protein n=5 Tax=Helicobacter pylori TaxID=210 RepID=A0A2A6S3Y3_HELPX|nr:hypothetical protein [Helicobacter pylori]OOQ40614.1 hypothetical protein B0X64_03230 [Helicobacter pylori]PDW14596.1 hypothetical protein BB409_00085 [Helicobacter pylori]PDX17689.1 hypothetical protein BB413_07880 [Helicobacter pylori]PDX23562.1 hypothetical protein BB459_08050 [Helicobacter pylori]PDX45128.1 hypothetical protein BB472_02730 [Helicobacter pylori]